MIIYPSLKNYKGFIIALCTAMLVIFAAPQLIAVQPTQSPQRLVAVTFDDLPVVTDRDGDDVRLETTNKLVASIVNNKIPAIGFVNEIQLFDDDTGKLQESDVNLLRTWLRAGLELGNHTYSHINLNEAGLTAYEKDTIKGEIITKKLLKSRSQKLRYFRHPYLHTGRNQQIKQGLQSFLTNRGYTVAPVTIFLEDWTFSHAYDKAFLRKNKAMMQKVGKAYLPYVERELDYWEQQSVKLFGREIKQTLLFHANTINARYFGQIAKMLKKRGYKFITLNEALQDKAYKSPDNYVGDGISWLHRWALTRGKKFVLQNKPKVPDFVASAV